MPCDASYMDLTEAEENSKEVATLIKYVVDTKELEGWYDPVKISKYTAVADKQYGETELLDEMTAFLCSLCNHMNESMKDRVIYNGRNPVARRLANWWDKHQDADNIRGLETEETEDMKLLSKYIDMSENRPRIIYQFLSEFLQVMDEEDHSMSYLEGMERVMDICMNEESKRQ